MRPLSKTDLRRSRPAMHPPERVQHTSTGAAEEALLFGESGIANANTVAAPSKTGEIIARHSVVPEPIQRKPMA